MGGDLAWDDTTRAIHQEIHALRDLIASLFARTNPGQPEAKPPEPGWLDRAEAQAEYERSRVDRLKARAAERRRKQAAQAAATE
ncbi:hypothetical protein [Actinomyces sp. 432]|uniref:hypothetical protein n=1 Tax=Actinomyces sp. 432 TaxID=2057798 RepID=UPI001F318639|nr:hypothetical protein [Actinomyces sp. 432]